MTAELIYVLGAATSGLCFVLLLRAYLRTRSGLLLWSSAAFLAFTIANIVLVLDLVFLPDVDLLIWRNAITLAGVTLLLCGLVLSS